MTELRRRLAWGVLLASLSCHSFAQFGGGGMGAGMGGGRRGRSPDAASSSRQNEQAMSPQTQAGVLRDKLYDLRLRLMITPAQAPLWDAFSGKVWDLSLKKALANKPPVTDDLTVVQLAQRRAADAGERAARLQELSDAIGRLYAGLTPDQQQIANQVLPPMLP